MGRPRDTVYDAEPHTKAKHAILKAYFDRWLLILSRHSAKIRKGGRLLYVDGFAGAGEYTGDIPGSPVVAINAALEQHKNFSVPVQIQLIELQADRVAHLQKVVDSLRPQLKVAGKIVVEDPIQGDCETVINRMIAERERQREPLGPALFFLDQFGYSFFSMRLINHILAHNMCETFSYLNWNRLYPYMTDQTKHESISRAFGGDEWKEVVPLRGQQKEDRFREIYLSALRERGGAQYACPFVMRDKTDRVIYWLFFSTNNIKGLEEMKKAMWTVDRSGGFEFSDRHVQSFGQLFNYTDETLTDDLAADLDAKELKVSEVKEYILVNTRAYRYKGALGLLEETARLQAINPPKGRRRGTFNEPDMRVKFSRTPQVKAPTLF